VGVGDGTDVGVGVSVGSAVAVGVAVGEEALLDSESHKARRPVAVAAKSSAAPARGSRGGGDGERRGPSGGWDQFQSCSRERRRPKILNQGLQGERWGVRRWD